MLQSVDNQQPDKCEKDLKIVIVTTPIRPIPTEYPPLGSLSVITALKKAGYSRVEFYDIDGLRPAYDEVLETLRQKKPDILGISAIVSTAYEYTKRLSLDMKQMLPHTTIVLGGNLGASAEILLRRTGVEFVVLGEGERVIVNFVKVFRTSSAKSVFESIPGLVYFDSGRLVNTGYEAPLPEDQLYDIDWKILERSSKIENFFPSATEALLAKSTFSHDLRIRQPHRRGKNMGTLVTSKGCVGRCTFCHRWEKGIRNIPVPIVMERLRYIVDSYNVGFITFGDECFGSNRRWLMEFCKAVKEFDVLWRVSGMRVDSASPEHLGMMRNAGCSVADFGMETGSKKMLRVIGKKAKVEQHYNVLKWMQDAGLHTTIQLVLGMPGENWETIKETARLVEYNATLAENKDPLDISINYAQALPGTPLYEYARSHNLIGQTIDDEEKYLIAISDRDASDEATTLQLSGYPKLVTEQWRPYLILWAAKTYIEKFGIEAYHKRLLESKYFSGSPCSDEIDVSGHSDSIRNVWKPVIIKGDRLPGFYDLFRSGKWRVLLVRYPLLLWRLRFLLPLMVLGFSWRRNSIRYVAGIVREYIKDVLYARKGKARFPFEYKSLREIVEQHIGPLPADNPAVLPLRRGR